MPAETPAEMPAVELESVTVTYGNAVALEDVTLRIAKGEQVAVVGPNGAGKSTLFNVIVGLLKPTQGRVRIEGDVPQRRRSVGYVPQRNQSDPRFPVTVRDVVMMGRTGRIGLFRWPSREDRDRVDDALAQTEMLHLAEQPIGALSGGQQQRAFLARALAQEARLLLLDEPLNGLDLPSQERLTNVLNNLRHQGITILMATHDLNSAGEQADSILLLNRRVMGYGSARSVLDPDVLQRAYGNHLHVLPGTGRDGDAGAGNGTGNGVTLITDTCCSGGNVHHEPHIRVAHESTGPRPMSR